MLMDEERFEFWDGEKIMMTPSSPGHESIVANLVLAIGSYVKRNGSGRIFSSNTAVYLKGELEKKEYRMPDISYVAKDRLPIVKPNGIFGSPDLVIEVVSPGMSAYHRDVVEKYHDYEEYGVKEYWIVDPFDQRIVIHSLQNGKYTQVEQSVLFPNLNLRSEDIFEDFNEL